MSLADCHFVIRTSDPIINDQSAVGNYYQILSLSFDGHFVKRNHFKIMKDFETATAGRNLLTEAEEIFYV